MTHTYTPHPDLHARGSVYRTGIPGLFYIAHQPNADARGFFLEVAAIDDIEGAWGRPFRVVQVNHSRSVQNVVRGLHAEDWNKLVMVASGVAFCALADVRPASPTFGKVETFLLGHGGAAGSAGGALFIESGVANSFCVVEGPVDYVYAVDKRYTNRDPKGDQAIALFDPDLNIQWPIDRAQMIISERDRQSKTLRALFPERFA